MHFEGQPIKKIDLVPDGDPGTRIELSRLMIAYGSSVAGTDNPGLVSRRHGEQLGILGSTTTGIANLRFDKAGLKGRLTRQQAIISDSPQPPLVVPNKIGAVQRWLLGTAHSPLIPNIWVVALLLGLASLLLASTSRPLVAAASVVAIWILAYLAYEVVPDAINPAPPVAIAVGGASFFGTPYLGQQIAAGIIVLSILAAATAIAVHKRRLDDSRRARAGPPPATAPAESETSVASIGSARNHKRGLLIVFCAWAVASLTIVPALGPPESEPVSGGWDVGNLTVWNFFSQHGLTPMKDFWLPYGFQWLFGQTPLGPAWAWLANSAMLGLFTWSMWRLSSRSVWRTVASVIAIVLLSALGGGLWRYLPALLMAMTYAALGPAQLKRPQREQLLFFASTLLALLIEPDLLLFGLAGAAFVVFGDLLFGRLKLERGLLVRLLVDSIPMVGAIVVVVLVWTAVGSLEGNLDYFGHLFDATAYGASDQVVDGMLSKISLTPSANAMVASLPFLVLGAGLALGFLGKEPLNVGATRLLLGTAGASLVFLGRGLVRPNDLLYYLPLVGFCCAAILLWNRRAFSSVVLTGAFFGAVLTSLQYNGGLESYLGGVAGSPIRAADSLTYLGRPDAIAFAKAETYALRRYENLPDIRYADELETVSRGKHPSFAVLGDAQILYMWFKQRPPYHVNLYDGSPLRSQRKVIEKLESERPSYMVWKQENVGIDGVPYTVRDPLVYAYAIQHYGPSRPDWRRCKDPLGYCTGADILKRRPANTRASIDFWTWRLGHKVDLGFVPSYAKRPQDCQGSDCTTYAVIRGKATKNGEVVKIEATGRGGHYAANLQTRPDTPSYTVRLDRLWFWPLLGPRARVSMKTPGWSVEIEQGKGDDRLY